jgi:hypothetical protein
MRLSLPLKCPEPAHELASTLVPERNILTLSKFFRRSIILPVTSSWDSPALAE